MLSLNENDRVVFFALDRSDDTLIDSIYRADMTYTNQKVRCITEGEDYGFAFVLVSHNSGFNLFTYSISDNTFNASYSNSSFTLNFVEMTRGFSYFSGMVSGTEYSTIHKVLYDGVNGLNSVFSLGSNGDAFLNADSDYSISINSGVSVAVSNALNPVVFSGSLTDIDPGTYQRSALHILSTLGLYYLDPLVEYTVIQNWSGLLEFDFTCAEEIDFFASKFTSFLDIVNDPTWLVLNNDTENLFVSTPVISEDTDYHFAIVSGTATADSLKFAKITVTSSVTD